MKKSLTQKEVLFPKRVWISMRCHTYPDKAVMEMHSDEASSNAWILGHSLLNSISNNCLCAWTASTIVTNPKWWRGSSHCGNNTRENQTTIKHQFHTV